MGDKTKLIMRAILLPLADYSFIQEDSFEAINKIVCTDRDNQDDFRKFAEINIKKLMQVTELRSIDEAKLLLQKFHYKKFVANQYTNIHQYYFELINDITKMFITHRDGEVCLKYWTSEIERNYFDNCTNLYKLTLWSELTKFISPDILYVNFLIQNNYSIGYLNGLHNIINLADDQLDKVLSKGVSETHVHMNATNTFDQTWENLTDMSNISNWNDKLNKFNLKLYELNPLNTSNPLNKKAEIIAHLKYTAVLRIVIMHCCCGMNVYDNPDLLSKLNKIKNSLCAYNFDNTKTECDDFYENRVYYGLSLEITASEIFDCEIDTIDENIFLYYVLEKYKNNELEEFVTQCFFDYLRIKNDLLKIFIQTSSIRGLEYFSRHYDASTNLKSLDKKEKDFALKYILNNKKIKKIELRPGIGGNDGTIERVVKKELQTIFNLINESYDKNALDEDRHIGIIYSFIKAEDDKVKCLINALEENNHNDRLYYQKYRYAYFKQLEALNNVRKFCPTLSKYVVGIDAASIENNTEPWVFAPIYKKARSFNTDENFIDISNQSLRFTFHVGEEFRDIISGLRHIDEVIEKFGFKAGDRIGHGIALGVDIDYWFDNNETIIIPAIEYLDNLLWMWGIESNSNFSMLKDGYLERKILELADRLFNNTLGCYDLWKAYQQKFEEYDVKNCSSFIAGGMCKFQDKKFKLEKIEDLVHLMHCSVYLEKMTEPIIMTIDKKDIKLYKSLQKYVLEKVAKTGIVVETNPSSNVTIAELKNMNNHYIFNLVPIENPNDGVIATISSDDPSVFNTNICNEIAYIYHALIDNGYNRTIVLEWIKKVIEYGMDYSFVKNKLTRDDVSAILGELE